MIREPFLKTRGIHNFRDYGGWRTRGGGQVRTGLLFRSGHHVEATDDDLAAIAPLGIHTVIDLRGESERAANPCRRVEGFDGQVLFYEGETTSSPPHMDIGPDTSAADFARERMLAVYTRREFLRTNDSPTFDVLARQSLPGIEARLGRKLDEGAAKDLLGVREEYLDRYLEIATERHGSFDTYLEAAIGVDDALREALIARFVA